MDSKQEGDNGLGPGRGDKGRWSRPEIVAARASYEADLERFEVGHTKTLVSKVPGPIHPPEACPGRASFGGGECAASEVTCSWRAAGIPLS